MLFCDSRWQCFAWLVNLPAVAVYSLLSYFWCSTVDSIQFHVECCSTVPCRCRYITDISLLQLLPWSGPKCIPADTNYVVVCCSYITYRTLCTIFLRHGGVYNDVLYNCILAPIILPFPVDINHVQYNINIVDININYVFLSEYPNWTTDSTCWRESVHMWRV